MPELDDYYAAAIAVLGRADTSAELAAFLAESADGKLRFQHCLRCGAVRFLAAAVCPECLSPDAEWRVDTGDATIWSFCVYHRAFAPEFQGMTPYAVCLVELDSGPRLITNPVNVPHDELAIGMRGRVAPVALGGGSVVPYFFARGRR